MACTGSAIPTDHDRTRKNQATSLVITKSALLFVLTASNLASKAQTPSIDAYVTLRRDARGTRIHRLPRVNVKLIFRCLRHPRKALYHVAYPRTYLLSLDSGHAMGWMGLNFHGREQAQPVAFALNTVQDACFNAMRRLDLLFQI